jgi:hypothetical protein
VTLDGVGYVLLKCLPHVNVLIHIVFNSNYVGGSKLQANVIAS